jgi:hypothetical protein
MKEMVEFLAKHGYWLLFGRAMLGAVGGDERIGSDGFTLALTLIPEFEEVASFGMDFIPASTMT